MTRNRNRKKDTRSLAEAHGVSYTAAMRGEPSRPTTEPHFGPRALPSGPPLTALTPLRSLTRQHPLSLWASLYSLSADDFTSRVREHRLGDTHLAARLLTLRDPLVAVVHGTATNADRRAVAASGDLPPRTVDEPAHWLAGALLDAAGFAAVSALTEEGLLTLRDELIDEAKEREDDADSTVQLLGAWLQDVAMLKGAHLSMRAAYLGDERPLLHRDREAGADPWERLHLAIVTDDAFDLLAEWDLHVSVTPDRSHRGPLAVTTTTRDRDIFETAPGVIIHDNGTPIHSPVPPVPPPTRAAFGTGAKSHPTPRIDPYDIIAERLRRHGLTVNVDNLRTRLRPGVLAYANARGIPHDLADTAWTEDAIASFISATVADARTTGNSVI